MAGRSDFNAVFPRSLKRAVLLGLGKGYISKNNGAIVKQLFISAHENHKRAAKKASKLMNRDSGSDE